LAFVVVLEPTRLWVGFDCHFVGQGLTVPTSSLSSHHTINVLMLFSHQSGRIKIRIKPLREWMQRRWMLAKRRGESARSEVGLPTL